MAFNKLASLNIEKADINLDNWVTRNPFVKTAAQEKFLDFKKIIKDFDPKDYLLTHCTIIASVKVEDAPVEMTFKNSKTKKEYKNLIGRKDYYITPDTSKYVNNNGDAWTKDLLKSSYESFIGGENYVEHVQDPKLSKGKIIDAVLREINGGDSYFVDILVATNKKHKDLVNKISSGELNTLSMGASVDFTICSKCGNIAEDETQLCEHIKFFKKNVFIDDNGKKRITAELCGHYEYPKSNNFIEGSWVENPAFPGAVMRNKIDVEAVDKKSFIAKYGPVFEKVAQETSRVMTASLINALNEAPEETPEEIFEEEIPLEETEEVPSEEAPEDAETPKDEELAEEPVEEESDSKVPEELESIGEPPEEDITEDIKEEAKKPYDVLKDDIKNTLKEQIKKELLQELGTLDKYKTNTPSIPNLNETLVQSKKINASIKMGKTKGLKSLYKCGYVREDILKIAFLSEEYPLNKEVFKTIIKMANYKDFNSYRRYIKAVECQLGRDLAVLEKMLIRKLIVAVDG